jgi:hypothetical protein
VRAPDPLRLLLDRTSAVGGLDAQPLGLGDRSQCLGDLACELARRDEDQRGRLAAVARDPLDDRHAEGQRLA